MSTLLLPLQCRGASYKKQTCIGYQRFDDVRTSVRKNTLEWQLLPTSLSVVRVYVLHDNQLKRDHPQYNFSTQRWCRLLKSLPMET